jgi:hypothetical protein
MPLTSILVRSTFTSLSPIVDNVSQDLSYVATIGVAAQADVISLVSQVGASYSTLPAGATHTAAYYIGPVMSATANAHLIQAYDITTHLDGSPHGSPVVVSTFGLTGTRSAAALPEGVCAAITLQAPYGSDVEFAPGTRPRARDRGRIYFGPLSASGVTTDASQRVIITAAAGADLLKWIKSINTLTTPGGTTWVLGVWSRKNAGIKVLQEAYIDDRPDYQRRRTDQSSARYVQLLP